MKAVERRVGRLEDRLAPRSKDQLVAIVQSAGRQLALDNDRCIEILREAGHIDPGTPICLVDLTHIPTGLNAAELERHFRAHGVARTTWAIEGTSRRPKPPDSPTRFDINLK